MKQISREINSYLMDLDNCVNSRSEFEVILKLEQYIKNARSSMCYDENGKSYFILANDIMMEDICKYLEDFRKNGDCPGKDFYKIKIINNTKSKRLSMDLLVYGAIKTSGLKLKISGFPQYTISIILGLDTLLGEEYIKYNHFLLKDEYEKFIELRQANPKYFLPFIKDIITNMQLVEVVL